MEKKKTTIRKKKKNKEKEKKKKRGIGLKNLTSTDRNLFSFELGFQINNLVKLGF
jgi:hypothetical protein